MPPSRWARPLQTTDLEQPAEPRARPRASARLAALRMLATRRLTEAQLWSRLVRKGYPEAEVRIAVDSCIADGFVDDALFAQLFVDGRTKAVGDSRLVAELVRRGIATEAARRIVASAEHREPERLARATDKLFRTRPTLSYPSAARALERLGFPASEIYRHLRSRAASDFAVETFDESAERFVTKS